MLRLPPRVDVMPTILAAVALGPTLVVVPEHSTAQLIATRLRRAGLSVALVPDDWAMAAAGVDVVIGTAIGCVGALSRDRCGGRGRRARRGAAGGALADLARP